MFGVKDPCGLRTCVLYKFLCADSNACYVCETPLHLSTRVGGHLQLISDCILKFSDIYIILHNVALFVLMSIVTSQITLPQLFNLKSKEKFLLNEKSTKEVFFKEKRKFFEPNKKHYKNMPRILKCFLGQLNRLLL